MNATPARVTKAEDLSTRTIRGATGLAELAPAWDRLLESCRQDIVGPDITASYLWASALLDTQIEHASCRTLVISSADRVVGLLPTFAVPVRGFPFGRVELKLVTEAHAGRPGLLIEGDDPALTEFVLRAALRELAPWDAFIVSVVEHSRAHANLQASAARLSLPLKEINSNESPFIVLPAEPAQVTAGLAKKMRWTIRKGESDLRALGALEYEQIRDTGSVTRLLGEIYAVEKCSWKEGAGTSITAQGKQQAFYEALAPRAAAASALNAHVLRLNGMPIAYILGITDGAQVFLDLKESFDIAHADHSPGHVLKRFAMERLVEQGVRTYDFMGKCEPYKMRWTDKTYRVVTFALFNRTLRGRLALLRAALASRVARGGDEAPAR